MPLDLSTLKNDLVKAFEPTADVTNQDIAENYIERLARNVGDAIDKYVRSGDVTQVMTSVNTTGAGTGAGTGGNAGGPILTAVQTTTTATGIGTQSQVGKVV